MLAYWAQTLFSLFDKHIAPPPDLFAAASITSFIFMIHLFFRFRAVVPLFLGIGFVPHVIGLYKIIPYNEYYSGTLYGWSFFNYHYDWIVHFFAIFCFSIAFCSIFYPYYKKNFKSKFLIFVLILFFMLGLGAFNEILEYVGFDVLGYGEGFLEFGPGDCSPYEGPWQNSSMDLIFNLFGAVSGIGLFLIVKECQEKIHST